MKVVTQARVATRTALAAIVLIAVMIALANREVVDARDQRTRMLEIAGALAEMRLVTFEYVLYRQERARTQARAVAARLERLLADPPFHDPEQAQRFADLRERNTVAVRAFAEFVPRTVGAAASPDPAQAALEEQLASRLLLLQQDSAADAFELTDHAVRRIDDAQRRVVAVIAAGLALVALATMGTAWLIDRRALRPLRGIGQATHQVAAGHWAYQLPVQGDDEIAEMARNFNAMTRSLRDAFARLEQQNHDLAALNQELESFSHSVSHDLRAPLRALDGFSQALLEDHAHQLDAQGADYLRRIIAASQRMGRLIDELLGLARVTRADLHREVVDLGELANDVLEPLRSAEPTRAVHVDVEDDLQVMADRGLLRIALANLLGNAWKFTGRAAEARIRIGARTRGGHTEYFVADNGVGFDMAHAQRLFGAFQRLHADDAFEGTGIGLATVQRVVRRHGGHVRAEAEPGRGATFWFTLQPST